VRSWVVVVAALAGCVKSSAAVLDAGPAKGHPDLVCPAGASAEGYGPPVGRESWCMLTLPDGRLVREGAAIEWHDNGARKVSGNYAQGRKTGEWVTYHPTGTPEARGTYLNDKKDGVWTTWAPTGEKIAEGPYVDGVEHGAWTFWTVETLVRTEGNYVLGGRDGKWIDYSPEGKATRERIYREGRLLSQREL
jgi:hypothetical protein